MDITAAIATLRTAGSVLKAAGKIDLYQQVIDLQQVLVDGLTANSELAAANHRLQQEVRELKDRIAAMGLRAAMHFDGQVYWSTAVEDADGPFCPRCKDKGGQLMRVTDRNNGYSCCVGCDFSVDNDLIRRAGVRLSVHEAPPEPFFYG